MIPKHLLLIFTPLVVLFTAPALFAQTVSLKQAINLAIENNEELHDFYLDKKVRIHELRILKQKFTPQLYYNLALTLQNEDYFNDSFIEKKIHSYPSAKLFTPVGTQIEIYADQNSGYEKNESSSGSALHVVVEQPLLKGVRPVVNNWSINNAQLLNEIEDLLYTKALERIIYSVIMQYHVVQLAKENVTFQERWLHQSQRFFENLQVKVSAGRAPVSDLTASEFEIKQAENYLSQAQLGYRQEIRRLLELLGSNDQDIQITSLDLGKESFDYNDEILNTVYENDIETKIIKINKKRLKQQLLIVKDEQLVDLKLRGDVTMGRYHVRGEPNQNDLSDKNLYNYPFVHQSGNYSAHLLLSVPITGKDRRNHQKLIVKTELEKLELESRNHAKSLQNLVVGLLEKAQLKKQQVALTRQALVLAQKNYDEAMMKLDAGRATLFEVVTLREKLHDAQMSQQATEISYLDIIANIELTAGLLAKKWLN